ncbi:hypothetical protein MBLNU459_g6344t1 [Dothideomycetes sp. NU459]
MHFMKTLHFAGLAGATLTITDPSDFVGTTEWEADNALIADYNVQPVMYQFIPSVAPYVYTDETVSVAHKVFTVDKNDSSVVIVTNGSTAHLSYDTFVKYGYSTNLLQASFFGVNAAVWAGNASTLYLSNSNITVHNGAANVYSYGTDTVVHIENTVLYSSGPVSHGLYGAGNGTIIAKNVDHYSGGMRSSAFSGDNPAGYIHVSDSVAHTDGIGSAVCYALGLCNITNVIGHSSHAPVMFMDSNQEGIWTDCDLTAGLLAGMIIFSSAVRSSGGAVTLDHTKLTTLGSTMPSLWFGNTIASAKIISSQLNNTASGLLVVANMSQVTQDFDYFAGYEQNSAIAPAEATVNVFESSLFGDLVAYNGSSIDFSLKQYSSWEGKAYSGYGDAIFAVHLDTSSSWSLTGDTTLQNFTDVNSNLSNIHSNGYNIFYDSSSVANKWLNNRTIALSGGGRVSPAA